MKLKSKELWAKCFLKTKFTGGVSTTSRIEGLHAKQKKYMISNANLQGVLNGFRSIEKTNISNFKDEYSTHEKELNLPKYCKGLNYTHQLVTSETW